MMQEAFLSGISMSLKYFRKFVALWAVPYHLLRGLVWKAQEMHLCSVVLTDQYSSMPGAWMYVVSAVYYPSALTWINFHRARSTSWRRGFQFPVLLRIRHLKVVTRFSQASEAAVWRYGDCRAEVSSTCKTSANRYLNYIQYLRCDCIKYNENSRKAGDREECHFFWWWCQCPCVLPGVPWDVRPPFILLICFPKTSF